ncbi:MAG: DUF433 domain-containing protein [Candidatus Omnitrophica bacterium]|nr:DUF433 domain-containing protein [Candidatus Omnitrophota bacterium]
MSIKNYITTDPQICHGKPCFKDTRIMVYLVLEMLADGETSDSIIKNAYPKLSKKHIEAALHYAAQMAKAGHMVETHAIS